MAHMTSEEARNTLNNTNMSLVAKAVKNNATECNDNSFASRRAEQELKKYVMASQTLIDNGLEILKKREKKQKS